MRITPSHRAMRIAALLAAGLPIGCASGGAPAPNAKLASISPVKTTSSPISEADGYYGDAVGAIGRRDYGRALDLLQLAKARAPGDVRVLNAFGVIYDKLGRFDLSARYYAQAQAIAPDSQIVASNMAYSRVLQGDLSGTAAPQGYAVAATATAPPLQPAPEPLPIVRLPPAFALQPPIRYATAPEATSAPPVERAEKHAPAAVLAAETRAPAAPAERSFAPAPTRAIVPDQHFLIVAGASVAPLALAIPPTIQPAVPEVREPPAQTHEPLPVATAPRTPEQRLAVASTAPQPQRLVASAAPAIAPPAPVIEARDPLPVVTLPRPAEQRLTVASTAPKAQRLVPSGLTALLASLMPQTRPDAVEARDPLPVTTLPRVAAPQVAVATAAPRTQRLLPLPKLAATSPEPAPGAADPGAPIPLHVVAPWAQRPADAQAELRVASVSPRRITLQAGATPRIVATPEAAAPPSLIRSLAAMFARAPTRARRATPVRTASAAVSPLPVSVNEPRQMPSAVRLEAPVSPLTSIALAVSAAGETPAEVARPAATSARPAPAAKAVAAAKAPAPHPTVATRRAAAPAPMIRAAVAPRPAAPAARPVRVASATRSFGSPHATFWISRPPLQLINASGRRHHGEPIRQGLVMVGWSAPAWAMREAPARETISSIRYPSERLPVARALAATLPGPVRLVPCAKGCTGLQLVLGTDALKWGGMRRWSRSSRHG